MATSVSDEAREGRRRGAAAAAAALQMLADRSPRSDPTCARGRQPASRLLLEMFLTQLFQHEAGGEARQAVRADESPG
ncbi:hypothetical protein FQA47_004159 [Oryzias melastigma]|uniref:Uncharacterized protein n=1 Tax=Oryzias melastigma TaxID=30732 RepID=A0A834FAR1_ORYME|nr:hypothetical protein FQA47_004159 [Oryzias melastigma]